jgi:A/G-specific adenine glycosylase
MPQNLAQRILRWYQGHKRDLPWRGTADAYRVWVSEIMLQQTQVETVIPYYQRWIERFPDLPALAAAPQHDVLALWEGLGYYSRARNLHRAAQIVANEMGGQMPKTEAELRRLPGIGRYTAAAIASIAFGADAAVLDGNVRRVLARFFDVREDAKSTQGEKKLWALAASLVPPGRAGDYNQALMDLGATVCVPRAPACPVCPLRATCLARRLGVQHERPVAARRVPVPRRQMTAVVIHKNGRVLIEQRPTDALLGGLWAFPTAAYETVGGTAGPADALLRDWGLRVALDEASQVLEHTFTHFKLKLHVYHGQWQAGRLRPGGPLRKWVRAANLADYPMGKLDRQIALGLMSAE